MRSPTAQQPMMSSTNSTTTYFYWWLLIRSFKAKFWNWLEKPYSTVEWRCWGSAERAGWSFTGLLGNWQTMTVFMKQVCEQIDWYCRKATVNVCWFGAFHSYNGKRVFNTQSSIDWAHLKVVLAMNLIQILYVPLYPIIARRLSEKWNYDALWREDYCLPRANEAYIIVADCLSYAAQRTTNGCQRHLGFIPGAGQVKLCNLDLHSSQKWTAVFVQVLSLN